MILLIVLFIIIAVAITVGLFMLGKVLRKRAIRNKEKVGRVARGLVEEEPKKRWWRFKPSPISPERAQKIATDLRQALTELHAVWHPAYPLAQSISAANSEISQVEQELSSFEQSLLVETGVDAMFEKVRTLKTRSVAARRSRVAAEEALAPMYTGLDDTLERVKPLLKEARSAKGYILPADLEVLVKSVHWLEHYYAREVKDPAKAARSAAATRAAYELLKEQGKTNEFKDDPRPLIKEATPLARQALTGINVICAAVKELEVAAAAYTTFAGTAKPEFREPQKPTQEEVERYLRAIESWITQKLTLSWASTAKGVAASEAIKSFDETRKALATIVGNLGRVQFDKAEPGIETAIQTLQGVLRLVDAWRGKISTTNPVWLLHGSELTPPQEEQIALLRKQMRTVGFAVAQLNVARSRLSALESTLRVIHGVYPSLGQVESTDQYLEKYALYLQKSEENTQLQKQRQAQIEVLRDAVDARDKKVSAAAETMSKAVNDVNTVFGSSACDQLRIVVTTAVELHSRHVSAESTQPARR